MPTPKKKPDETPEEVGEAQETQPDDQEEVVLAEEVEVVATPLDIESRRLEHQRRVNKGGK